MVPAANLRQRGTSYWTYVGSPWWTTGVRHNLVAELSAGVAFMLLWVGGAITGVVGGLIGAWIGGETGSTPGAAIGAILGAVGCWWYLAWVSQGGSKGVWMHLSWTSLHGWWWDVVNVSAWLSTGSSGW